MISAAIPAPRRLSPVLVAISLVHGVSAPALAGSGSFAEALTGGKASIDARLRYESVDQDNALKNANAFTARVRLGYMTGEFAGFGAFVEAEHVNALGGEGYNSTTNGKTAYSVVADPEATEMNQAYLSYSGLSGTVIKYGRQRIKLDNDRFVGNVGWRQNEQTYDALSVVNSTLPNTTITAAYITNVNRVFSDESTAGNFQMSSPIFNVKYSGFGFGEFVGYAYLLDFDTLASNSTQTYGIRFNGSTPIQSVKALYTAEFASQRDYKDNPGDFSLSYYRLEGGVGLSSVQFNLGQEKLSGNGRFAFQTPLATLHAMNGWTDQFLSTPANGLKDTYVSASTTVQGLKLAAVYHDFRADKGSAKYGTEWNLVATKKIGENYAVGAKYGRYNADSFKVDTDKVWLWAEAKF
ncbi:MAG: hypothetical protein DWQ11_15415 [Proteobacteria bacterium]|nr:MAG: hypothetical protein DWQ11_15415 [Pseudomonadota bacterium]